LATSRRRERELARRRFERRRQAELERRARAKRRNTIIGAVIGVVAVIVVLVIVGIFVIGGGNSKKKTGVQANSTPTSSTSSTPAPAAPTKCATIKPNPPAKGQPTIPPVKGKVPASLVKKDITKGHGPAAKAGATMEVTYIGVSCDTGKVFDATYRDGGKPFKVTPLGSASVIQGWNQGLEGMRAGGVRELIIPAALGYGASGSPPAIQGNDTLIFLVTAKSVKNA
jgi:peptidylprolyl isomerase